jgi:hypothetical protein
MPDFRRRLWHAAEHLVYIFIKNVTLSRGGLFNLICSIYTVQSADMHVSVCHASSVQLAWSSTP